MKVPALDDIQKAARMIEVEGLSSYGKVVKKFGIRLAQILTVAYLRFQNGALQPGINPRLLTTKVEMLLAMNHLYGKFNIRIKEANKKRRQFTDGRTAPLIKRGKKTPAPEPALAL